MAKNGLYGLVYLFLKLLVILSLLCHSIFPLTISFSNDSLKFMNEIDSLDLIAILEFLLLFLFPKKNHLCFLI